MKLKSSLITGALVAAVALCGQGSAFAASKKAAASPAASASPSASAAASPGAAAAEKPARAIPFRGTVSAVDASAKTFTIAGKSATRVFKVTDTTTITKDGATGAFTDIAAEGKVSGSYYKQADGTLECKSVKIGGAADAAGSSKKSKKADAAAAASAAPSATPSPSATKK